jgi:hypothetical protein
MTPLEQPARPTRRAHKGWRDPETGYSVILRDAASLPFKPVASGKMSCLTGRDKTVVPRCREAVVHFPARVTVSDPIPWVNTAEIKWPRVRAQCLSTTAINITVKI